MDICFYHANCSDGFCAAYVANLKYPGIDLIPINYGDAPDLSKLKGKKVLVVDFSFPRQLLMEMKAITSSLVVLDHHESAKQALEGLNYCLFDMTKSGAMLTWEYCFPDKTPPSLVAYVQDRDLWKFEIPFSKAINAYIRQQPQTLKAWDTLYYNWDKSYFTYREIGTHLLFLETEYVNRIAKNASSWDIFPPHKCKAVNSPILQSEIGSTLLKDCDIAIIWFAIGKETIFSLRSKEVNVAELAKKYGGGGHPKAAGFKLKSLSHVYEQKWFISEAK